MKHRIAFLLALLMLLATPAAACTIFCFTFSGKTYFCNNEDWRDPLTEIRFNQATDEDYAWVYLGFSNNWSQGGVNEHGLCYDWVAGGGPFGWESDPSKTDFQGNLSEEMLRKCRNVDEVIAFYNKYNERHLDGGRTLVADKAGNSVLVHWRDGKLQLEKNTERLHSCGVGKQQVESGLNALESDPGISGLVKALSDGRSEGTYATKYSNIMSLSEGKMFLFQNRDYSQYLEIDFAAKLTEKSSNHRIADLFSKSEKVPHVSLKKAEFEWDTDLLQTSTVNMTFQIGKQHSAKWTVMPELDPDTLYVECSKDGSVRVTFTSDQGSKTVAVSRMTEPVQFHVVLPDGTKALTEVVAIPPKKKYVGDYSANRTTADNWSADLDPLLQTYFEKDSPGGSVAVWKEGKLVYKKSIGLANVGKKIPHKFDELFDIASVSKEFAAFSILKLVDQEKLSLDDPLEKFYSGIPNGEQITLHHLLTHTSGIPEHFRNEAYDRTKPLVPETALNAIRSGDSQFQPGERYEYGGAGYYLLSRIVEKVSGQDYQAFVSTNLLEPAGMSNTRFTEQFPISDIVPGYKELDGAWDPTNLDIHLSQLPGVADLTSTLADLRKWHVALFNGKIVSKQMIERVLQPKKLNDGSTHFRTYGFMLGEINGVPVVYNSGDYFSHTRYLYCPSKDISVVLSTNFQTQHDGGIPGRLRNQLAGKMLNSHIVKIWGMELDLNEHP